MNLSAGWIASAALRGLLMGLCHMAMGRVMRQRRGLSAGKTVSLDKIVLRSPRLGLTGRPDRIIKAGGSIIIEEWKSSWHLRPEHLAQMGVNFLLVQDQLRIRPTHGFIVCSDGTRHRIENDDWLRRWVLGMAEQIRAATEIVDQTITVKPVTGQCRPCGMQAHCKQARI